MLLLPPRPRQVKTRPGQAPASQQIETIDIDDESAAVGSVRYPRYACSPCYPMLLLPPRPRQVETRPGQAPARRKQIATIAAEPPAGSSVRRHATLMLPSLLPMSAVYPCLTHASAATPPATGATACQADCGDSQPTEAAAQDGEDRGALPCYPVLLPMLAAPLTVASSALL